MPRSKKCCRCKCIRRTLQFGSIHPLNRKLEQLPTHLAVWRLVPWSPWHLEIPEIRQFCPASDAGYVAESQNALHAFAPMAKGKSCALHIREKLNQRQFPILMLGKLISSGTSSSTKRDEDSSVTVLRSQMKMEITLYCTCGGTKRTLSCCRKFHRPFLSFCGPPILAAGVQTSYAPSYLESQLMCRGIHLPNYEPMTGRSIWIPQTPHPKEKQPLPPQTSYTHPPRNPASDTGELSRQLELPPFSCPGKAPTLEFS